MPSAKLPLHERALRLLAVRPRTRRELSLRLRRAGFEPEDVAVEIARLEDVGLIDDARFAAEYVEHALDRRLEGRRAVVAGLSAKGVDRRVIRDTLEAAAGDDGDRLDRLAEARAARLGGIAPEAAYRRLVSFLVRRGHDPGPARAAAVRALRLAHDATDPG